jgi:hypothetical protein
MKYNLPRAIVISQELFPEHFWPRARTDVQNGDGLLMLGIETVHNIAFQVMPMAFPFYKDDFGLRLRQSDAIFVSAYASFRKMIYEII